MEPKHKLSKEIPSSSINECRKYNGISTDTTILVQKGKVAQGSKKNKTWVTVFVTVNADGSDKHRALLVNKFQNPIAFHKVHINPEYLPLTYQDNWKA